MTEECSRLSPEADSCGALFGFGSQPASLSQGQESPPAGPGYIVKRTSQPDFKHGTVWLPSQRHTAQDGWEKISREPGQPPPAHPTPRCYHFHPSLSLTKPQGPWVAATPTCSLTQICISSEMPFIFSVLFPLGSSLTFFCSQKNGARGLQGSFCG